MWDEGFTDWKNQLSPPPPGVYVSGLRVPNLLGSLPFLQGLRLLGFRV